MLRRKQLRRVLEVCPHVLSDASEADTGVVVDGESGVFRVVHREHAPEGGEKIGRLESLAQLRHPHDLEHLLQHDFDKNSGRRGRLFLVHVHDVQHGPRNTVRSEHVPEEPSDVAQLVRLVSVNGVVILHECLLEALRPYAIKLAESFTYETVECVVRSLLRTTLDNHVAQLDLGSAEAEEHDPGMQINVAPRLTSLPSGMLIFMSLCTASSKLSLTSALSRPLPPSVPSS